jgi:hypothetical protein
MRRILVAALILAALGTLAACAPQGPAAEGDISELALQPASGQDGEGDSALLAGTLRLDGGCTYVEVDGVGDVVPVFQEGDASWAGDTLVFTGAGTDMDSAKVGDRVELGGGYIAGGFDDEWVVPDGCRRFTDLFNVAS